MLCGAIMAPSRLDDRNKAPDVREAWRKFFHEKRELIIRSFEKTGIALPMDGSMGSDIPISSFTPDKISKLSFGRYCTHYESQKKADRPRTKRQLRLKRQRVYGP
ncbi:Protein of unknown function [Pyronema omphalodes CBS 100304]|uniref:Uncharacterized protein n=1 Tax=Pyronema omphalodes (strain CBS 100304) TaxID=1076935 RepID=U4L3E4_PYROM|nr:Protein of unknown function [Pyronema omphalodes CBS 100304]